jgi:hypothetical protein
MHQHASPPQGANAHTFCAERSAHVALGVPALTVHPGCIAVAFGRIDTRCRRRTQGRRLTPRITLERPTPRGPQPKCDSPMPKRCRSRSSCNGSACASRPAARGRRQLRHWWPVGGGGVVRAWRLSSVLPLRTGGASHRIGRDRGRLRLAPRRRFPVSTGIADVALGAVRSRPQRLPPRQSRSRLLHGGEGPSRRQAGRDLRRPPVRPPFRRRHRDRRLPSCCRRRIHPPVPPAWVAQGRARDGRPVQCRDDANRPRSPGPRRPAPDRTYRPTPSAQGARPDRSAPDRLGQCAGAQPGAGPVRQTRAAPARADRRRHARPRAVRVLGARVERGSDRAVLPLPLADERSAPVAELPSTSPSKWATTSSRCTDASSRKARWSPAISTRGSASEATGGTTTTASPRSSRCSTRAVSPLAGDPHDFARVYDLPERLLPADALARPALPAHEARKELLVLGAKYHGVGTLQDLADYHRLGRTASKRALAELVEEGRLRRAPRRSGTARRTSIPRPGCGAGSMLAPC